MSYSLIDCIHFIINEYSYFRHYGFKLASKQYTFETYNADHIKYYLEVLNYYFLRLKFDIDRRGSNLMIYDLIELTYFLKEEDFYDSELKMHMELLLKSLYLDPIFFNKSLIYKVAYNLKLHFKFKSLLDF